MGDPGMYTSARGKNKKGTEGKRMDASNNAARKFTAKLEAAMMTGEYTPVDRSGFGKVQGISSSASKAKALRAKLDAARASVCANPACSGAAGAAGGGAALKACKGCAGLAHYCGTACQSAHWPAHKGACKAAAAAVLEAAAAAAAAVQRAAAAAGVAAGAAAGEGAGEGEEESEGEEEDGEEEGEGDGNERVEMD
jgi:hypothetical protein